MKKNRINNKRNATCCCCFGQVNLEGSKSKTRATFSCWSNKSPPSSPVVFQQHCLESTFWPSSSSIKHQVANQIGRNWTNKQTNIFECQPLVCCGFKAPPTDNPPSSTDHQNLMQPPTCLADLTWPKNAQVKLEECKWSIQDKVESFFFLLDISLNRFARAQKTSPFDLSSRVVETHSTMDNHNQVFFIIFYSKKIWAREIRANSDPAR